MYCWRVLLGCEVLVAVLFGLVRAGGRGRAPGAQLHPVGARNGSTRLRVG